MKPRRVQSWPLRVMSRMPSDQPEAVDRTPGRAVQELGSSTARRNWSGVLAPSGTPTSVIRKLSETINAILQSPELQPTLDKLNARPKIGTPQDFAAFIAAERQKWTEIVTRAGIKVQ